MLYVANQNPHVERLLLTAFQCCSCPTQGAAHRARRGRPVSAQIFLYAEDVAVTWAAKQLNLRREVDGRPARRGRSCPTPMAATTSTRAEMAMDGQGRFLSPCIFDASLGRLPVDRFSLQRARPSPGGHAAVGGYTAPQIYVEVDGWFAAPPVDAYHRGATARGATMWSSA